MPDDAVIEGHDPRRYNDLYEPGCRSAINLSRMSPRAISSAKASTKRPTGIMIGRCQGGQRILYLAL